MGGTCRTLGERIVPYGLVVGTPEGKRPLGRNGHKWEDNIKMDHQVVGSGVWIGLIWLRIGTGGGHL
jgi:hypothetical protein